MRRIVGAGVLALLAFLVLPGVATAQNDCAALKKAFEDAKREHEAALKNDWEASQAVQRKQSLIRDIERSRQERQKDLATLKDFEAKRSKAVADDAKWLSKNEMSLAKQAEQEAEYWAKEIADFKKAHPDVEISDSEMEARAREAKAEEEAAEKAFHDAEARLRRARERYDQASRAYQACHPDEHAKVPPGTCDTLRKKAEGLDVERHRLSGPGKDPKAVDDADRKYHETHKQYCQCLWVHDVRPLPWECAYYEPRDTFDFNVPSGALESFPTTTGTPPQSPKIVVPPPPPPAKSVIPPPPPPKSVTTPPPTKTATPPPPPPIVAPPPPPKAPAPPPPSTGSVTPPPPPTSYVCGKSPCDCLKQNPPKKCTTSSCVCAKG